MVLFNGDIVLDEKWMEYGNMDRKHWIITLHGFISIKLHVFMFLIVFIKKNGIGLL